MARGAGWMALLALAAGTVCGGEALPTSGTVTETTSFSLPKSPSGMFYYEDQGLLYILCGTDTNRAHYLYAYTPDGTQRCFITIPEAVGMSRVDGFFIEGSKAYIVDSQGPIYSSTKLGGSIYEVDWSNPCGCGSDGTCTSSTVSWTPTITSTITIDAEDDDIEDGGGNDQYFRNSGIVVKDTSVFAVNGVHPNPALTCCYPKSLVKLALSDGAVESKWSFTASTIGHDVDMEGLTCGADGCDDYIYIGDEYNYIYKLNLSESNSADAVEIEWDINSIVGSVPDDKGIESLTYGDGKFFAGIQETGVVHVLTLSDTASTGSGDGDGDDSDDGSTNSPSSAGSIAASAVLATILSLLTVH